MLGTLAAHGYEAVDVADGADVILVNTCAIREHAEQRVLGRLGELKRSMKPGFIKAGDEVTIKGYHARDLSQNAGAAREIVL